MRQFIEFRAQSLPDRGQFVRLRAGLESRFNWRQTVAALLAVVVLVGTAIWALAFSADHENILAGGIEDIVYSWPIASLGEFEPMAQTTPTFLRKPEEMDNGERQFVRKCSVCHALTKDSGRKAGPTLHGIFGRKAGTLPGYSYSETLYGSEILWDEHTIDRLFDLGPDHYIPGSKMPMQRIVAPQDRTDLIEYLRQATN